MTVETWALLGVNSTLLGVASFFIKQWISQVKDAEKENRTDFQKHKEDTEKDLTYIRAELGKRKGETELLRKDLELLSAETRKNFEAVNIHMNYQKTSLDEIKNAITAARNEEMAAISELVKLLKNKS
jgi:hypothetical protein